MVVVAQLVRATDCGSVGRGFESRLPPEFTDNKCFSLRFVLGNHVCHIRDFFIYTIRRLNSDNTIAVAEATLSDSEVNFSGEKAGI